MQQNQLDKPSSVANKINSEFNQALALAWAISFESGLIYLAGKLVAGAYNTGYAVEYGASDYMDANGATYALAVKPVNLTANGTLAWNSGYGMNASTSYPQSYANQQSYYGSAYDNAQDPTSNFVIMLDTAFWLAAGVAIWRLLQKVTAAYAGIYNPLDFRTNNEIAEMRAADREDFINLSQWVKTLNDADRNYNAITAPEAPKQRVVTAPLLGIGGGYFLSEDPEIKNTYAYKIFHNDDMLQDLFSVFCGLVRAEQSAKYFKGLTERFGYALVFTLVIYLAININLERDMAQDFQNIVNDLYPQALADVVKGGNCEGDLLMADCKQTADGVAVMQGTHDQQSTLNSEETKRDFYAGILFAVSGFILLEVVGLVLSACKKTQVIVEADDVEYGLEPDEAVDSEQGSVHSAEMVEGAVLTDSQMEANVEFSRRERFLCGCLRGNKSSHFRAQDDSAAAPLLNRQGSPRNSGSF